MDDIRLIPCPSCSGQPVVLIQPGWPYPTVRIVCSACGKEGPTVYYAPEDMLYHGLDFVLLPGLARARREAAACWNYGADGGGGASG